MNAQQGGPYGHSPHTAMLTQTHSHQQKNHLSNSQPPYNYAHNTQSSNHAAPSPTMNQQTNTAGQSNYYYSSYSNGKLQARMLVSIINI